MLLQGEAGDLTKGGELAITLKSRVVGTDTTERATLTTTLPPMEKEEGNETRHEGSAGPGFVPGFCGNSPGRGIPGTLCTPQEVDLSGVREEGGRLVGEVRLPEGLARGRILVDCPVPGDFPQEQRQKLQVQYQPIEEKELTKALQALEQEARGGRFESRCWAGQTFAQFTLEKDLPRYYFWGTLMEAGASRDSAYQRHTTRPGACCGLGGTGAGAEACEGLLTPTGWMNTSILQRYGIPQPSGPERP